MRRLIWKELMESRYIPLAYAGLMMALLIVWDVTGGYVATHGGQSSDRMNVNDAVGSLAIGIIGCGLLSGSNAVAGEAGQGTLAFLFYMPVSKARIWWSKVIGGTIVMTAAVTAMLTVFFITLFVLLGHQAISVLPVLRQNVLEIFGGEGRLTAGQIIVGIVYLAAIIGFMFAVSLFASTLVDRPLAAFGLALLGSVVVSVVYASVYDPMKNWFPGSFPLGALMTLYVTGASFGSAYIVFRHGETASKAHTYIIAAVALIAVIFPAVIAGCVPMYLNRLSDLERPTLSVSVTGQVQPLSRQESIGLSTGMIRSRIVALNCNIDIRRVQPDHPYVMYVQEYGGFQNTGVLKTLDVTSRVRSQLTDIEMIGDGKKQFISTSEFVKITYIPQGSTGPDTQTIKMLTTAGKVVGTITIQANKSWGYFPRASNSAQPYWL